MFSGHGVGRLLRACLGTPTPASSSKTLLQCRNASSAPSRVNTVTGVTNVAQLKRTQAPMRTYPVKTPSMRQLKRPLNPHLWKGRPVLELTVAQRKTGGRNNTGRITTRRMGGGHKRRLRLVDFSRMAPGPHDVVRVEYDPGRSAHIALVRNRLLAASGTTKDGFKLWSYILACEGLRAGDVVVSYRKGIPNDLLPEYARGSGDSDDATSASLSLGLLRQMTVKPGNVLPISFIPVGTMIHNVSLKPNGPGILIRSAGTWATVVANEDGERYAHIRLQSGETRLVLRDCVATVGRVSNPGWGERNIGKAGRNRWLGKRPRVRGMAMNAVDHPHGGGRGKLKGNKQPRSLWGWHAKGTRTRKSGLKGPKGSNKFVVEERRRGSEKRALRG